MASKRHQRRKSCEGKKPFASQQEAEHASSRHERTFGAWMLAYHCKFCHKFHIGHPPRRVRQAVIARRALKA